jgi:hypothetical protein
MISRVARQRAFNAGLHPDDIVQFRLDLYQGKVVLPVRHVYLHHPGGIFVPFVFLFFHYLLHGRGQTSHYGTFIKHFLRETSLRTAHLSTIGAEVSGRLNWGCIFVRGPETDGIQVRLAEEDGGQVGLARCIHFLDKVREWELRVELELEEIGRCLPESRVGVVSNPCSRRRGPGSPSAGGGRNRSG